MCPGWCTAGRGLWDTRVGVGHLASESPCRTLIGPAEPWAEFSLFWKEGRMDFTLNLPRNQRRGRGGFVHPSDQREEALKTELWSGAVHPWADAGGGLSPEGT